ncbi:DMT family transporter [Dongia soli]|uniref:EamA family transporter n=1 Tax=Dongia soli TaxID=600628 RepID=A0ABU5E727_9PROT|nr:EamA family transporter [Dongia soli]MDY0882117.1 EamA family transporter [Dongia soli]
MTMQIGVVQAESPGWQNAGRRNSLVLGQRHVASALGRVPPTLLILLSILSVQLGSALATVLFSSLGPAGTAVLSAGFSAAMLSLANRLQAGRRGAIPQGWTLQRHGLLVLVFGAVLAGMLLPFFLALQYIPLGIASAIAFLGPLTLAVLTSRRLLHFVWIGIAVIGLVLLTPDIGVDLDPRGLGLAVLTGVAWAGFVPLSKQAGRLFAGIGGLAWGMWAAAILLLPFALVEGSLRQAGLADFGGGFAVALLSTVLPCVMEFQALRRLSARSYGILMTLEPALGALVGAIFLSQDLGLRMLIAIVCVTVAAIGMTLSERQDDR